MTSSLILNLPHFFENFEIVSSGITTSAVGQTWSQALHCLRLLIAKGLVWRDSRTQIHDVPHLGHFMLRGHQLG
jgi:hypothetical protein